MTGRENKGPPSADLLVCFPSRAHLTLMPKPFCSPARPGDQPSKRHHNHHRHHPLPPHNRRHHRRSRSRGGGPASPLLWAKTRPIEIAEPTSPKVTCAGQIKVRPKPNSCKNWQSVMEEIERLHNNRKQRKKATWAESLGFKKDVLQFLTCLRNLRFDFRCFGAFPSSDLTSDDEGEDEDEDDFQETQVGIHGNDSHESSRTVFSKWFMALQEDQSNSNKFTKEQSKENKFNSEDSVVAECAPPPNALLLMRCRSAPAKSWLEEREEEEEEKEEKEKEDEERENQEKEKEKPEVADEENRRTKKSNSLEVVMRYDTEFYKLSSDIAKETWVVGGMRDQLSRSKSWKR